MMLRRAQSLLTETRDEFKPHKFQLSFRLAIIFATLHKSAIFCDWTALAVLLFPSASSGIVCSALCTELLRKKPVLLTPFHDFPVYCKVSSISKKNHLTSILQQCTVA